MRQWLGGVVAEKIAVATQRHAHALHAADTGFGDVQVREIESDPINFYYIATK